MLRPSQQQNQTTPQNQNLFPQALLESLKIIEQWSPPQNLFSRCKQVQSPRGLLQNQVSPIPISKDQSQMVDSLTISTAEDFVLQPDFKKKHRPQCLCKNVHNGPGQKIHECSGNENCEFHLIKRVQIKTKLILPQCLNQIALSSSVRSSYSPRSKALGSSEEFDDRLMKISGEGLPLSGNHSQINLFALGKLGSSMMSDTDSLADSNSFDQLKEQMANGSQALSSDQEIGNMQISKSLTGSEKKPCLRQKNFSDWLDIEDDQQDEMI